MMTKEQERQTLAKIEKLIASCGEDSYVAQAFRGCCEMASKNIEDDDWNSMQDARDVARVREAELRGENSRLQAQIGDLSAALAQTEALARSLKDGRDVAENHVMDLTKKVASLDAECDELKGDVLKLTSERNTLKAKQLPADLYKRLWLLVDEKGRTAITRMDELTETLADLAGAPLDIAVAAALKNLAKAKKERDEALALLQELDKYEPQNI